MHSYNKTNLPKAASALMLSGMVAAGVVWAQSRQARGIKAPLPTQQSTVAPLPSVPMQPVLQPSPLQHRSFGEPLLQQPLSDDLFRPSLYVPVPYKHAMDEKATKAFEDQATHSLAVEKEARRLLKERRFAEAERACHRALALSPKFNGEPMGATSFQLLGDIYREQGRYQDAIDTYLKARQHTRDLQLDLGIALSYLKLGDMKNARKFYSEKQTFAGRTSDLPPAQKATYIAQLPGTKTAKTMEASIYFARGCEKSSVAQIDEAVEDYKKALRLVPRNALIASKCAWDLGSIYRGEEATPYWARAAVFGTGETAREGLRRVRRVLMPDKVEQALRDAQKIR